MPAMQLTSQKKPSKLSLQTLNYSYTTYDKPYRQKCNCLIPEMLDKCNIELHIKRFDMNDYFYLREPTKQILWGENVSAKRKGIQRFYACHDFEWEITKSSRVVR